MKSKEPLGMFNPIKVILIKERSNGVRICTDKARIKYTKGEDVVQKMFLWREKEVIKPPENKDVAEIFNGKKSKQCIWIYSKRQGDYVYVTDKILNYVRNGKEVGECVLDNEDKQWIASSMMVNSHLYKKDTFFSKYGGIMTILALCIGITLILWVFMRQFGGMIEQTTSASRAIATQLAHIHGATPPPV